MFVNDLGKITINLFSLKPSHEPNYILKML